jgi:hypothetical protein
MQDLAPLVFEHVDLFHADHRLDIQFLQSGLKFLVVSGWPSIGCEAFWFLDDFPTGLTFATC